MIEDVHQWLFLFFGALSPTFLPLSLFGESKEREGKKEKEGEKEREKRETVLSPVSVKANLLRGIWT